MIFELSFRTFGQKREWELNRGHVGESSVTALISGAVNLDSTADKTVLLASSEHIWGKLPLS